MTCLVVLVSKVLRNLDLILDRRIPDKDTLTSEVTAWMHDRNVKQADIGWRFTTADARIKLKRLYPAILP